jgi:hypothetical protein
MSAIDQITTLLETMSFAEKLSLNERIATAIRKEGGGKAGKTGKASKKADDGEAKPKRKAAAGTLAWTAFVKHIKTTQPDAFEGITKESDKLQTVKGIRAADMAAYDAFVSAWKADYEAKQSDEEEVVAAPVAPVAPVAQTAADKLAALKASKAAAAAPAAPAAAAAKKEVKKATPAKVSPAAKPAKKEVKAAKKEESKEEIKQMSVLTLDEVDYWHDEDTNGLWRKDSDVMGGENWTGYYQPGNEEEPIRYTDIFDE